MMTKDTATKKTKPKCTRCKRNEITKSYHLRTVENELDIHLCEHCWANWAIWLMGLMYKRLTITKMLKELLKYSNPT